MNRECLRRMKGINAEFEQSESSEGPPFSESIEEQVCDEEAWSRMGDEGCPNYRQQRDPPEDDVIGIGVEGL